VTIVVVDNLEMIGVEHYATERPTVSPRLSRCA